MRRDPNGFRWRTRTQIDEGRSWVWLEDGVILFKAEASAWTPAAVQLQQVWVDPPARRTGQRVARAPRPDRPAARARPGGLPLRPRGERACDPALRDRRHAPHARLPERAVLRRLLLARHAHARSNADDRISSLPPGEGLSDLGVEEALALREALAHEPIELGVATRLRRTQETLELALGGRDVERLVVPGLDEIGFGAYEGGPLAEYRTWAWSNEPDVAVPGGRREPRRSGGADRGRARGRSSSGPRRRSSRSPTRSRSATCSTRPTAASPRRASRRSRTRRPSRSTPTRSSGRVETLGVWATAPRFVDPLHDPSLG